jgi:hypothetical protein
MTESSLTAFAVLSMVVVDAAGSLPQAVKKIPQVTAIKPRLLFNVLFIMKIFTKLGLPLSRGSIVQK